MIDGLLLILGGSAGTTLLGLLGYFVNRRLRTAQEGDYDASAEERRANAQKTNAEAWGLMSGNYANLLEQLSEVQQKLDEMQSAHRAALRHIVEVHDWDSRGRPGGVLPQPPPELVIPT